MDLTHDGFVPSTREPRSVSSNEIGMKIMEALGLGAIKNCQRLSLVLDVYQDPILQLDLLVRVEDADQLVRVAKTYKIVEVE